MKAVIRVIRISIRRYLIEDECMIKKYDATRIYILISFVFGLANAVVFTTNVIYRVNVVALDPLQLVLVGTTLEATIFLFEIPTGVVADVYSRRLSTIIGVFLVGVGFVIEALAPLFAFVLFSQVIWGLGWTFVSGARSAWITDETSVDKVGEIYLRSGQYGLAGSLLAIPLSVILANQSLALPYLVGGGMYIVLGICLVLFMPEAGFQRRPKEERQAWGMLWAATKQGFQSIRASNILILAVIIGLFVGMYSEGWDRLEGAHLLENFTFPTFGGVNLQAIEWFGILRVVSILLGLGVNELVKCRLDNLKRQGLAYSLRYLYLGMVISMGIFALTRNFFVAITVMLAFTTLRGVTFPLTDAWINKQIDSKVRATVLSMTNQVDAFGQMVGGPLIGAIGVLRSLRAAIFSASLILFPTVPLYSRILKITRSKNTPKRS